MRLNSFSLFVTNVIAAALACAAIQRSLLPITSPRACRLALIGSVSVRCLSWQREDRQEADQFLQELQSLRTIGALFLHQIAARRR